MPFQLVDASKPRLAHFFSPFIINVWSQLLQPYPDQELRIHLVMLLCFVCLLGYTGLEALILSSNLPSALIDQAVIDKKLAKDLHTGRVEEIINLTLPFISSPLGLVSKHDGGLRKIYYLLYPRGSLVNDYNADKASFLSYTSLQRIFEKVLTAGRHDGVAQYQ